MSVGDQVKITLCSNPTTGFAWQEPEISDAAGVSLVDKSFGAPVTGAAQVVGAAGTDYITLKATARARAPSSCATASRGPAELPASGPTP